MYESTLIIFCIITFLIPIAFMVWAIIYSIRCSKKEKLKSLKSETKAPDKKTNENVPRSTEKVHAQIKSETHTKTNEKKMSSRRYGQPYSLFSNMRQ